MFLILQQEPSYFEVLPPTQLFTVNPTLYRTLQCCGSSAWAGPSRPCMSSMAVSTSLLLLGSFKDASVLLLAPGLHLKPPSPSRLPAGLRRASQPP